MRCPGSACGEVLVQHLLAGPLDTLLIALHVELADRFIPRRVLPAVTSIDRESARRRRQRLVYLARTSGIAAIAREQVAANTGPREAVSLGVGKEGSELD
jgi:hypothetical protein